MVWILKLNFNKLIKSHGLSNLFIVTDTLQELFLQLEKVKNAFQY